ncbi:MAG TPA: TetR/AcrR family transcriptional regulator [Actinomycetes bacterium]
MATTPTPAHGGGRAVRADARRNRARVLEVAIEAFATEGLSLPVHEIARRAGVGTGTVSRHFPTKESLFEAIVFSFAERLVGRARQLAATEDPGAAFFDFFAAMVGEGAANRALADALAGAGFDVEAAASRAEHDVMGALRDLLARAQQAGAVRDDVDAADVKALMVGCLARERPGGDPGAVDRMVAVVREGLRRPSPG